MQKTFNLRKLYLFSDLNDEEIKSLNGFTVVRKYSKGEIIFFDSEPYTGAYGILEGKVKIYKLSEEGREHIIHIEYPGSTFGEVPMFENPESFKEGELTYPANAMALVADTILIRIPVKQFSEFLTRNNSICLKMLAGFAKRMRFLNSHIENLTLNDVTKRLSRYILLESAKQNTYGNRDDVQIISLEISKYNLASHLGTITETLSRVFKKMQDEGIIEVKGKNIIINDRVKLYKYSK